jgi:hypothetical protein
MCIPLSLLGNGLVKTLSRQRIQCNNRIVGRVVFCAVHIVSKGSMQLVLPRTSCFIPKIEDCPLSCAHDCLFIITSVTLHFWRSSRPSADYNHVTLLLFKCFHNDALGLPRHTSPAKRETVVARSIQFVRPSYQAHSFHASSHSMRLYKYR